MRIYYCKCGEKTEVAKGEVKQCKCDKVFGGGGKISDHINMRRTLSGTTQMEFDTMTMDESIKRMNK